MENLSLLGKNWALKNKDSEKIDRICQKFNISTTLSSIISSLDLQEDEIENFLDPKIKNSLPNPFSFKDMDKAVSRTLDGIKNKEQIAIFGDYDVDGATSSSILFDYLRTLGLQPFLHIPERLGDGYGPNEKVFSKFKNDGATLCITVDCGITAYNPISHANKINLDIIVLDHHEAEDALPMAYAIVNPKRKDDLTEHKYFAAVGVVYLFLIALQSKLREDNYFKNNNIPEPDLLKYADLVALGTVCDVVPLIKANRAFVKTGLSQMQTKANIGLKALCEVSGIKDIIDVFHLGFVLGPRINAGGRVGVSSTGAKLLLSTNETEAYIYAQTLNEENEKRKKIESAILEDALSIIEQEAEPENFIYIAQQQWHIGIMGIIASKLKEKFNLPTLIGTIDDTGLINGSCRSINQINIGQVIIRAKEKGIIEEGGGHKMAAGFSLRKENEEVFLNFVKEEIKAQLNEEEIINTLFIDSSIDSDGLTLNLAKELKILSPFGAYNEEPRFLLKNARLHSCIIFSNKHLKCVFKTNTNKIITGLLFNYSNNNLTRTLQNKKGEVFELTGKIKINNWQGNEQVQFLLEDARVQK